MFRLIRELVRPHRWQLVVVLLAMLLETAMSLAGPWPPEAAHLGDRFPYTNFISTFHPKGARSHVT
jgi:hypothetical protein